MNPEDYTDFMSEAFNADRLVQAHGDDMRYVPQTRKWLVWDGIRWAQQDDDAIPQRRALVLASYLPEEGSHALRFKQQSLGQRGLSAAVSIARSHPEVRVNAAELDANGYELNTPTGIVDLRTAALKPHRPESLHTMVTSVGYAPGARGERWEAFLDTTFQGDRVLIDYVQAVFGLAAVGDVLHHVLPFLEGVGANGKTVIMEAVTGVLGDQYAITAPAGFLLAGKSEHPTEIARLKGARLVACSEVDPRARFDEQRVKNLTGGEKLSGRRMHENFVDFDPTHTLFLTGNHRPNVDAGGPSFWRRLRLIHFGYVVPDDQRIEGLSQLLVKEEGEAVLAWIVEGAARGLRDGLQTPLSVADETAKYEREEDHMAQFVEDCCEKTTDVMSVPVGTAFARYQQWCRASGVDGMSNAWFGRELSAKGFELGKSNGKRLVRGLKLDKDPFTAGHGWEG